MFSRWLTNARLKDAILDAVNGGGDADSVASMAGGILSAGDPEGLPAEWVQTIEKENGLSLDTLAEGLAAMREQAG
jgi:ADP-ribosylglycohydrolase